MGKFLGFLTGILRDAPIIVGIIIGVILVAVAALVSWKIWNEAASLRRSSHKENLASISEIINEHGIDSHPIQAELVFRELFGIRLTIDEIRYFLDCASPLSGIIHYKHGYRYIRFDKSTASMHLTRSVKTLQWLQRGSIAILFVSFIFIVLALLFTLAAIFTSANAELIATGFIGLFGSVVLVWLSLDGARAVNAAVMLLGGWEKARGRV